MSTITITPYLFLAGQCAEALEFYRTALGAEIGMVMRFDQSPEPPPPGMLPPGFETKIMHAELKVGGASIFLSDGCDPNPGIRGFSIALTILTAAELDRMFAGLSAGGKITMPPTQTFWSPRYGMLTDRFGVDWMLMVPGQPA